MEAFQVVISPDIVDVLRREHEQIRQLYLDVRAAPRGRKRHPLAALQRAVHLHQFGERTVAHPALRNSGPTGDAIALAGQAKGADLERSLTELGRLGVEHPEFDARIAALADAWPHHASDQEKDDFPLLCQQVPAQRLHMMASAMQDARIMAGG
jgi:hypothetical protein